VRDQANRQLLSHRTAFTAGPRVRGQQGVTRTRSRPDAWRSRGSEALRLRCRMPASRGCPLRGNRTGHYEQTECAERPAEHVTRSYAWRVSRNGPRRDQLPAHSPSFISDGRRQPFFLHRSFLHRVYYSKTRPHWRPVYTETYVKMQQPEWIVRPAEPVDSTGTESPNSARAR